MSRIDSTALLVPAFARKLEAVLAQLAEEGIPLAVFETARFPSRQLDLYRRGRDPDAPDFGRTVTRAQPYESAHQWGYAADLVFHVGGRWSWEEPEAGMWQRMHRMAVRQGLTPLDFEQPHVQLAGWRLIPEESGPRDDAGWMRWLRARCGLVA
jgi:peptidoglycan L-alanyl-D-glutamate endopeptidase CwlK